MSPYYDIVGKGLYSRHSARPAALRLKPRVGERSPQDEAKNLYVVKILQYAALRGSLEEYKFYCSSEVENQCFSTYPPPKAGDALEE